jgi:hypothetical protein
MPQESKVGDVTTSVLQEFKVGDVTRTAVIRSHGENREEEESRNRERKDAEDTLPTRDELG